MNISYGKKVVASAPRFANQSSLTGKRCLYSNYIRGSVDQDKLEPKTAYCRSPLRAQKRPMLIKLPIIIMWALPFMHICRQVSKLFFSSSKIRVSTWKVLTASHALVIISFIPAAEMVSPVDRRV